jgi:PadR family transcriptional regulator, regulatory protein PadR
MAVHDGPEYALTSTEISRYSICVPNGGRAEVLQGTLDIMVLQTLASLGPSHGYAIAARIEQVSGGCVQLNMGTLYPGLMRLEQRGFVRGTWGVTENNRKARFYTLTPAGKKQLAVEKREWDRMVAIMQTMLSEPG